MDSSRLVKKYLSDYLGFLKYKVDNDRMTLEEEQAFVRLIEENIPLSGTSDDFARYYHQSPTNIRTVISRKMLDKPERKVMRSFKAFSRIVPDKWRK